MVVSFLHVLVVAVVNFLILVSNIPSYTYPPIYLSTQLLGYFNIWVIPIAITGHATMHIPVACLGAHAREFLQVYIIWSSTDGS